MWQDTAVQAHVENVRIFEMIADPNRKVYSNTITTHFDRHGIEIKIGSMQKYGT